LELDRVLAKAWQYCIKTSADNDAARQVTSQLPPFDRIEFLDKYKRSLFSTAMERYQFWVESISKKRPAEDDLEEGGETAPRQKLKHSGGSHERESN